jgi:hypothetical protein
MIVEYEKWVYAKTNISNHYGKNEVLSTWLAWAKSKILTQKLQM